MRIIIVGEGKVGATLTEYLSSEGHDIIVIDKNYKIADKASYNNNVIGLCGNGASAKLLKEAEVHKCDLLIAVTTSDEINILCCLTGKKLGAKNTIARVRNPEYSDQLVFMREELGLSMVVNPEFETAHEISQMLHNPAVSRIENFSKGGAELVEIKIGSNNPLCGKPLSSLSNDLKGKVLICAVQRKDSVFIPDGDFVIMPDDKIHLTATHTSLDYFLKSIGLVKHKVRSVFIIGGGKITYYLALILRERGFSIKIVEQDYDRCVELSNLLQTEKIIHGDGTDQSLLLEEGIENSEAFISLTHIDEENILASMYATTLGIGKVITKVNRTVFKSMLGNFGLDSVVSPKNITANRIDHYVRAMQNAIDKDNVQSLYKIVNNQVEALEFKTNKNSVITGKKIKDMHIKANILIAGIIRNNNLIIPSGNDTIEAGDSVIVVSMNHYLSDINDIVEAK